ncbi:MAG: 4'-phosphopantetheinyl transferase superfamily protein [Gemmatimonadaceae bacterium]
MLVADMHPTHAVALATAAELGVPARAAVDADHRASRLAARRAVRALVGPDADVVIQRRPGRPPLALADGQRQVTLSLAHRDGLAVAIAAAAGSRVGIDLERLDAVAPTHVRYFLTARERRAADVLPHAALWALKEAAWKALALGDDVPLAALELDIDRRGVLRSVSLRGERRAALAVVTSPWDGYVMAAVWIGEAR